MIYITNCQYRNLSEKENDHVFQFCDNLSNILTVCDKEMVEDLVRFVKWF